MPGYNLVLKEQERLERAQKERELLEGMYFEVVAKESDIWIYLRNKEGKLEKCAPLGLFLPNWFFPETRIKAAKKNLIKEYLREVIYYPTDLCKRMSGPAIELVKHPYKGNEDE